MDISKEPQVSVGIDYRKFATFSFFGHLGCRDLLSIISRMRYEFERGSLGAMLQSSALSDVQQIIGEAADCSD